MVKEGMKRPKVLYLDFAAIQCLLIVDLVQLESVDRILESAMHFDSPLITVDYEFQSRLDSVANGS